MAKIEIYKTDNYRLFELLECNRPIDRSHVNILKRSIEEKNLLESNPILVNSQLQVIDGQHRLEACKELGIPVYYRVDASIKNEDMVMLNKFSKNWNLQDYINYYASLGNPVYILIKKLIEESPFHYSFTLALFGSKNGRGFVSLKEGTFNKIQSYEFYKEKLEWLKLIGERLKELKLPRKGIKLNSSVIRALLPLITADGFDIELFLKKLSYNAHKLMPMGTITQYNELFVYIYNSRNSKPIEEVKDYAL